MIEFRTDAATLTMMWQTIVLGMGMIFAVLGLLWGVLSLFRLIFVGKTPKEEKKTKSKEVAKTAEPSDAVLEAVIAAGIQAYEEDRQKELVAVLTAAVMAHREAEGETGEFRVVSFRRASNGRAWNSKK